MTKKIQTCSKNAAKKSEQDKRMTPELFGDYF